VWTGDNIARDTGKIFGLIPRFKSKDELLEEEFAKFISDTKPETASAIPAIKTFSRPTSPAMKCATSSRRVISRIWQLTRHSPAATSEQCGEIPQAHPGIREGLRFPEPIRQIKETLLDTDTKRRIDTARDILGGQSARPKSQVEQIHYCPNLQIHG